MFKEPSIAQLKKGDDIAFNAMYKTYRAPFIAFAYKYGVVEETALEIYQDSMTKLFENAASGKLVHLTSSVKTYVFSIGKYKILEHLRAKNKTVTADSIILKEEAEEIDYEETLYTERQQKLQLALSSLGERCKNILVLFYLKGLKINEIKDTEGYSNENTVKAQKSRCLKQLKELMNSPNS